MGTAENMCEARCVRIGLAGILLCLLILILMTFGDYAPSTANDSRLLTPSAWDHNVSQHYQYAAPFSKGVVGKTFSVSPFILNAIKFPIPESRLLNLTNDTVKDFVVATAASEGWFFADDFFSPLLHVLLAVRKYLPTHRIIVYDLGLSFYHVMKLKSACQVTVKSFDYKKYPEHVTSRFNYAWKPLIIHEVLQDFPGVLWLDSSARIKSSAWESPWAQVIQNHGVLLLTPAPHSVYAVTHPGMYQYLPSNLTELKRIQQKEAGDVLLYRTHHVYNNVIKWWVLCVLDKDCIAPIMERVCHWKSNDHYKEYHNCHRFDQSAINVLLANFYKFDEELYYAKDRMVEIYRGGAAPEQGLDKC